MRRARFFAVILALSGAPAASAQLGDALGFVKRVFGVDAKLAAGFTAGPLNRPIPLGPVVFTQTTITASTSSLTISSQALFKGVPICRASLEVTTRGLTLTCPVNIGISTVQLRGSLTYDLRNWQLAATQSFPVLGSARVELGSNGLTASASYLGISLSIGPITSPAQLPAAIATAVAKLANPVTLVKNVVSGAFNALRSLAGMVGKIGRALVCKFGTCIENRHRSFIAEHALPSGVLVALTPEGQPDPKRTEEIMRKFLDDRDGEFGKIKLEDWDLKGIRAIERELDEGVREGWMRTDRWYAYGRNKNDMKELQGIPPPWQVLAWHVGGSGRGKGGRFGLTAEKAYSFLKEKARRLRLAAGRVVSSK